MRRRLYGPAGTLDWLDTDAVSADTGLSCEDPTLAVQSSKDECDINVIVKRFGLGAGIPAGFRIPTYQDFLNAPDDYRGALEVVRSAEKAFESLPAAIRSRFDNDPGLFISFCEDPSNLADLREMGLAKPEPKALAANPPETAPAKP